MLNKDRRNEIARLADEWSWNDGAMCPTGRRVKSHMHLLSERNWRVQRCSGTQVVAIEPGREYETPFDGPDAFWAAVKFAADELKKAADD
jgi:hypothetical protein